MATHSIDRIKQEYSDTAQMGESLKKIFIGFIKSVFMKVGQRKTTFERKSEDMHVLKATANVLPSSLWLQI